MSEVWFPVVASPSNVTRGGVVCCNWYEVCDLNPRIDRPKTKEKPCVNYLLPSRVLEVWKLVEDFRKEYGDGFLYGIANS